MAGTTTGFWAAAGAEDRYDADYARQSHGKKKSVAEQLKDGRTALLDMGTPEGRIREYRDTVSASRFSTKVRLGWPQLLEDIAEDEIRLIAMWETSRGDRKMTTWSAFLDLCRGHRVLLHSVNEERTYDPNDPADYKALLNDGVDNVMESERTSRRVRRGTRHAAEAGRPHGRVPYGYRRVYDEKTREFIAQVPDMQWYTTPTGHRYQPAEIVRWIYRSLLNDVPAVAICRSLNDRGIPNPLRFGAEQRGSLERQQELADNLWLKGPVLNMLRQVCFIGIRIHRGQEIPNAWEALVDEETFYAARNLLDNPARRTTRGGVNGKHLLSYLAYCECGSHLARGASAYRCLKSTRLTVDGMERHAAMVMHKLDTWVEQNMVAFLSNPEAATRLARTNRRRDREEAAARAELERMTGELARIRKAALDPNSRRTTWADFEEAADRYEPEIQKLQERATWAHIPEDVKDLCGPDALAKWRAAGIKKRRLAVRLLMRVTVAPGPESRKLLPASKRTTIEWLV